MLFIYCSRGLLKPIMAQIFLSVGSGSGAFFLGFQITLGVETSLSFLSGKNNLVIGGLFIYGKINGLRSRVVKKNLVSLLISLFNSVNLLTANSSMSFSLAFAWTQAAFKILAFEIIFDSHSFFF